ncbi:MAG: hypothetical protein ACREOI_17495 [bacterium]
MQISEQTSLTDKNLDRLADLLDHGRAEPNLVEQIPDKAHIFHGSFYDAALTQANLKLANKILLGMILGYVEEAPLVMVFEHTPGKKIVIDLSSEAQKGRVQQFIEMFQEQSQQEATVRINGLLAA